MQYWIFVCNENYDHSGWPNEHFWYIKLERSTFLQLFLPYTCMRSTKIAGCKRKTLSITHTTISINLCSIFVLVLKSEKLLEQIERTLNLTFEQWNERTDDTLDNARHFIRKSVLKFWFRMDAILLRWCYLQVVFKHVAISVCVQRWLLLGWHAGMHTISWQNFTLAAVQLFIWNLSIHRRMCEQIEIQMLPPMESNHLQCICLIQPCGTLEML